MAHHAPRPPSTRPAHADPVPAAPRPRSSHRTTAPTLVAPSRGVVASLGDTASRGVAALVVLAVAGGLLVGLPGAAHAEPSVAEIERRIDQDWNRLEPIIERHNAVRQDLAARRREVAALAARIEPLQRQVDEAMLRVSRLAVRAYKGESVSAVNAMLAGRTPGELISRIELIDRVAHRQHEDVRAARELRDELAARKAPLDRLVGLLDRTEKGLAASRRQIDAEIDQLQKLRLRAYGKGAGGPLRPAPCPVSYPGGAAGEAVRFACAQIGKPYVWGAEGPHAYDCSGLMLAAWATAGVRLPHNAARQRRVTPSVSRSELRPGDLVFYYRDLHHVGMYVGGGWVVHAARAGVPVTMKRLGDSPIHSFGRPG
ncbi:glycoside hydrolase [Micromonospora rosaria]|uniref:Glycoside hydrolase n=1 Tax=Micromonospora rosaria TaxID=47874 RepID=A0A136PK67_9ACTN|nr:glycoside hydrolase [Micromonospora rosaria]